MKKHYCSCGEYECGDIPKLKIDWENNEEFGLVNFTLLDDKTKAPISNAVIMAVNDNGNYCTFSTDSKGNAQQVLNVGTNRISVSADGYNARNGISINVVHAEQNAPVIYMFSGSIVQLKSSSVTRMTMEELKEAGVSVGSEGDYFKCHYEIELAYDNKFVPYIIEFPWFGSLTDDDTHGGGNPQSGTTTTTTTATGTGHAVSTTTTTVTQPKPIHIENTNFNVYPLSPDCILVIEGEAKWLKEFFNVQLVFANTLHNESVNNAKAELILPSGLSLKKSDGNIGVISPGSTGTASWVVRGDEEGTYSLSARLKGNLDLGDRIDCTYSVNEPISVLGGKALKLDIYAPKVINYGEKYTIKLELTNNASFPVYNISNKIIRLSQYEISVKKVEKNGIEKYIEDRKCIYSDNSGITVSSDVLQPGEKLVTEISTTSLYRSMFESVQNATSKIGGTIGKIGSGTYLGSAAKSISGIVSSIPVGQVLRNNFNYVILEDSTASIPAELHVVGNAVNSINPVTVIGDKIKSEITDALGNGLIGGIDGFLNISKSDKKAIKRIQNNITDTFKITDALFGSDKDEKPVTTVWIENTNGSKINPETGQIIEEEKAKNTKDKIIDNVKDVLINAGDKTIKEYFPNYQRAVEFFKHDEYENTTTGSEKSKMSAYYSDISDKSDKNGFTINIDGSDVSETNGRFSFCGDALVNVTANTDNASGILHVQFADGETQEIELQSVCKHICDGKWEVVSVPSDDECGSMIKVCDKCGKYLDVKEIPLNASFVLDDGTSYNSLETAALHMDNDSILTAVNDCTVNKNVMLLNNSTIIIPENITLSISEGCNVSTFGRIENNGTITGDGSLNIAYPLCCDGETKFVFFDYGSIVNEIPQIENGSCSPEKWYCDEEMTVPFESFTAGIDDRFGIFYAESGHSYIDGNICRNCGKPKNKKDGFKGVSATLTDGVRMNYFVVLSDKALSDKNAYIRFSAENKENPLSKTIRLSDGLKTGDEVFGGGEYKFSVDLRPDMMNDRITAEIIYSNGEKGSRLVYSVKEYTKDIRKTENVSDEEKVLVDALMNYGGYAQLYTNNLNNGNIPDVREYKNNNTVGSEYQYKKSADTVSGIKVTKASLLLGSNVTIKIAYQLDNKNANKFIFSCKGNNVRTEIVGNLCYVYLENISPQNFDVMYDFSVSDGNNTEYFSYSVFSYIRHILTDEDYSSQALINLVNAMYDYNKAAKAYLASEKEHLYE